MGQDLHGAKDQVKSDRDGDSGQGRPTNGNRRGVGQPSKSKGGIDRSTQVIYCQPVTKRPPPNQGLDMPNDS